VPEVTITRPTRARRADQFQRPGAPVLPARGLRARRPAGEPAAQGRAQPQEPRHRAGGAARAGGGGAALGRESEGRGGAAGPPVLSRSSRDLRAGRSRRIRVAKRVREAFAATPTSWDDDTVEDAAPRIQLGWTRRRPRSPASRGATSSRPCAWAVGGGRDAAARWRIKYEVPVRVTLPAERRGELADSQAHAACALGALVPLSELVKPVANERDRPIHHKDLLRGVRARRPRRPHREPLYGMFGARGKVAASRSTKAACWANTSSASPRTRTASSAQVGRRMQVTYETSATWASPTRWGWCCLPAGVAQFRSYLCRSSSWRRSRSR